MVTTWVTMPSALPTTDNRASRRPTVSARPIVNSRLGPGTWMKSALATTKASHWLVVGTPPFCSRGVVTCRLFFVTETEVGRAQPGVVGIGREVQGRIYRAGVFGRRPVVPVEPAALEAAARRRMSPQAWAYVAGGAGQQRTVRANLEAFGRHRIVPRMLVDVGRRDLSVDLLGHRLPSPYLLPPIRRLGVAHRDPEHAGAGAPP